jgi:DNA-binding LacI/PurR family transcriptional regulator
LYKRWNYIVEVKSMSVTIKDIARIAEVSHTTVSRALNDSPLINEATKKKIREIAEELNYVPNYNAKSLVLDRSYNIGLFFSTLVEGTSPGFFFDTVKAVNSVLKDEYNLIVKGIEDYGDLKAVNKRSFDGIVVMSQSAKDSAFIYKVIEKEIPIVVLNTEFQDNAILNIISDDCKGSYKAVELIISNDHKKIAIIEGKKGFKSTQHRREGYIQALMDYSIPMKKEYMVQGNYDMESGYKAMKKLLALPERPTAVFCSNDDMAVGAYKAVAEEGLQIPEDISIAGFDDNLFSRFLTPALTTVKRPVEAISRKGIEKLLSMLEGKEVSKERIYVNTDLVVRNSIRKL